MATKAKVLNEVKPPAEPPSPPLRSFLVRVRGTFGDLDLTVPAASEADARQKILDDFLGGLTVTLEG